MIYFRQQTTFSQTELAALLEVSKSSISMHEKGGRSLPLKAERQLLALQKAWTLFLQEAPFADYAFTTTSACFTRFRSLLNVCTQRAAADAVRYSQQLEKIRATGEALEQKQRFVRYLMRQEGPAVIPQVVLKNLDLEIRNRLKNCGAEHQRILLFRINLSTALQQVALAAGKGLP